MKKQLPPLPSYWLPALVFFSGMAGLMYEILWMRMFVRVFGITLYATTTIISVYMGGLALGAWLFGRWSKNHPVSLKTLGVIEIFVALTSVLATWGINSLPTVYATLIDPVPLSHHAQWTPAVLRIVLCASILLVPTTLMGSTFPLLIQLVTPLWKKESSPLAVLYGVNTLGAVLGIVFAGFVSIGLWGERISLGIAAGLNLLVGLVMIMLPVSEISIKADGAATGEVPPNMARPVILIIAGASGFCALALEVIWTRILILLLGTSVYAFSVMLAFYLLGIGIGSLAFRRWVGRFTNLAGAFSVLQMLLALFGMLSLHVFHVLGLEFSAPRFLYSPIVQASDFFKLLAAAGTIILPVTILYGLTFPLLGELIGTSRRQAGYLIGLLYSANTIGGIVGSLCTVFVFVPLFGVQGSFVLVGLINLVIAFSAYFLWLGFNVKKGFLALTTLALLTCLIIPSKNFYLDILSARLGRLHPGKILFHVDSVTASLTGYELDIPGIGENRALLINGIIVSGKGMAGSIMAHYPLLLHPKPGAGLVICFGVGNTFRAAIQHIAKVDVVELVEGVVSNNKFFFEDADRFLSLPQARIFVNDGRNFLLTTKDKYDWIIVDASPPLFSEGTVNLYSLEFVALCKRRLNPGGLMCIWIPLPCFEESAWMIAQNFSRVFPCLHAWAHPRLPGILLIGSDKNFAIPMEELEKRFTQRKITGVRARRSIDLVREGWFLTDSEIREAVKAFPPVTDDHPYTEFPLKNFLRGEKLQKTAAKFFN